jgi:hypothetical protein
VLDALVAAVKGSKKKPEMIEMIRSILEIDAAGDPMSRKKWTHQTAQKIAEESGIMVTVAHCPTGASKWNPIEHRMFSQISNNWAGVPLETFDTVVDYASNTKTRNGLHIETCRDHRTYQKGIKVSDKEMRTIALSKSDVLGKWNYTIVTKVRSVCMQSSIDTEATISIHQTRQSARKTKCSLLA